MQQHHNLKRSPNKCITVALGCKMLKVALCSPQQHKGVSMNVKTFVFANSMRASITHAFDAHGDHCGSKFVQHSNALLYPRGCLYSKTTHHMLKLSANVSKLLRSTMHVQSCSFCCPVYVRLLVIRSMWLQWLAPCPWYMCVVCACV